MSNARFAPKNPNGMELNIEDLAVLLEALGVAMENTGDAETYGQFERLYTTIGRVVDESD